MFDAVNVHTARWVEAQDERKLEEFRNTKQMTNPIVDLVGGDKTGRIVPVYPQSEKARLTTWDIGSAVAQALRRSAPRGLADPVPDLYLFHRDDSLLLRYATA